MGVIDFHVHHYPASYLEAVAAGGPLHEAERDADGRLIVRFRGGVSLIAPPVIPDAAARLETMDAAGVDIQVLSVSAPALYFTEGQPALELARRVNDDLAALAAEAPSRFRTMATLPLTDPELVNDELARCLDVLGASGAMIMTNIAGVPLDDLRFEQFYAFANDRSLLLHVHPTVPVETGFPTDRALTLAVQALGETGITISRLIVAGVMERYPKIRWVFSHLGGSLPLAVARLDSAYRRFPEAQEHITRAPSEFVRELYYDTASIQPPAIRFAAETLGADRLVFGSDYPHVGGAPQVHLDALEAAALADADVSAILGDRARSLLGID